MVAVVNYVNAVRLHVKELAKPRLNIDSIVFVGIALGIAGIVVTVINHSKAKKT